jgi:hypothetical protein
MARDQQRGWGALVLGVGRSVATGAPANQRMPVNASCDGGRLVVTQCRTAPSAMGAHGTEPPHAQLRSRGGVGEARRVFECRKTWTFFRAWVSQW